MQLPFLEMYKKGLRHAWSVVLSKHFAQYSPLSYIMYYNPTTPYLTSGDVLSTSIAFETWEPFIGTQSDNINLSSLII